MFAVDPMFDTLAYANKLKAVGFNDKQAETCALAQAEMFSEMLETKLVTKPDIIELKSAFNEKMSDFKNEIKTEIISLKLEMQEFKAEIRLEMQEFKAEIRKEIFSLKMEMQDFKAEIKADIKEIKRDMRESENRLLIKFGGLMVVCMGLLTTLIAIVHV